MDSPKIALRLVHFKICKEFS